MTTETQAAPSSTTNNGKVVFTSKQHGRQKFYGSGLTADHSAAHLEAMMSDPTVFEDTKNEELAKFFSSLQPGDIVGVVGDLLVVPPAYSFDATKPTVELMEFSGGTISKPIAKHTLTIEWQDNFQLGIYFRAGFVEHLYRDAVATDGGQTMEVDEEMLKKHLKEQIEAAKERDAARAKAVQEAATTSEPEPANISQ